MNETDLTLFQEEMRRLRRGYRTQQFFLAMALAAIAGLTAIVLGNPAPVAAQSTADPHPAAIGKLLQIKAAVKSLAREGRTQQCQRMTPGGQPQMPIVGEDILIFGWCRQC